MRRRKKKNYFSRFMVLLLLAALIFCGIKSYGKIEKFIYKTDYSEYVEKYSAEYGVDKSLIYAIIKCESSFKPDAVSSIGAIGLMQLTPDTFEWVISKLGKSRDYTTDDLYNAEINIKFGTYLLKLHIDEFGSTRTAVAAYHAGRGVVNKWLNNSEYSKDGVELNHIPYGDTSGYVDKVINTQAKYINIYNFNKESVKQ